MLNQTQEKQVTLVEPNDEEAHRQFKTEVGTAFMGIEEAIPQFTKVTSYTSFTAEYAYVEADLVIHFFLPPERKLPDASDYWFEFFPSCLSDRACDFFAAGPPRLIAKYTEEVSSWWFRARGYAGVLDPDAFAIKFLKDLDSLIDFRLTCAPSP